MTYFDAAFIAKCYLNEPGAELVRAFAGRASGLCSAELGRVEFACVLHRHVREGHVSDEEAMEVFDDFREDEEAGVWQWLPVNSTLLLAVADEVRALPSTAYLRAADAIHLACARRHGFDAVYTNDKHMLVAAPHFGLRGIDLLRASP